MRKVFASILFLTALAASALMFGQGAQPVGMQPQVSVSAGRGLSLTTELEFSNTVLLEFRHCQKYAKTTGFWFWRKTVVDTEACNADPSTLFHSEEHFNLVTDAGFDFASKVLSDTAAQPAACNYVAVSNDAGAPAAGDTTLTGEITLNGLARAIGTFAHTTGTKVYTVTKVFTATGTQASQKTGLFNASSAGTMCYEVAYTQVTVNNNDTLTVFEV